MAVKNNIIFPRGQDVEAAMASKHNHVSNFTLIRWPAVTGLQLVTKTAAQDMHDTFYSSMNKLQSSKYSTDNMIA